MISRAEFLAAVRAGLASLPRGQVEEIVADYQAHFDEARTSGRDEGEVAGALGDPLLLASEHLAASRIADWERSTSTVTGWHVLKQSVARGALHTTLSLLALPLLGASALMLILTSVLATGGGMWFLFAGHSLELPGGSATVVLAALGLLSGGIALWAVTLLGGWCLINLLARRLRARFQLNRTPGDSQ